MAIVWLEIREKNATPQTHFHGCVVIFAFIFIQLAIQLCLFYNKQSMVVCGMFFGWQINLIFYTFSMNTHSNELVWYFSPFITHYSANEKYIIEMFLFLSNKINCHVHRKRKCVTEEESLKTQS